jgi:hypothetical protein
MKLSIHPGGNGKVSTPVASATIDSDLLTAARGPVTEKSVETLAEGGFSSEVVALAQDLVEQQARS